MTDVRQNFSLIAGDDIDVDYAITPPPPTPIDLTQADMTWTAYPQVRGVADKTQAVITKTRAGGGIAITDSANYLFKVDLNGADTMQLSGNYYYEIVILNPADNNARSTPTLGTMTVTNTADPVNLVAFKSMFPQVQSADDATLQTAIDEAALFVDDSWNEGDIAFATFALAAHFVSVGETVAATGGQTVTSERIGQISVSYAATAAGAITSGYPSLSTTPYGLLFLSLLRRNSPGIAIV
jgi:Protein of unknown function (DUF4054)